MPSLGCILFAIIVSLLVTACTPPTFTRTRTVWKPYAEGESKQEKAGVIVELKHAEEVPESFFATVRACDQSGRLLIDGRGIPVTEKVSFARHGQFWKLMALTNQTGHVIRLNQVTIRVFDPAGNQLEPLTTDDLSARLLSERPCSSSPQAVNQLRAIKIFDRKWEIVPGTTATFWVVFAPPSIRMAGVWKFVITVLDKVDEAGRTTQATQFELRGVVTQFIDTYTRERPFAQPKLIETKEVTL